MPSAKTKLTPKPPVVTIMGHVDHGKTTLLDYIRHTNVTAREAGGITQHIGAYQISHKDQPITFIDTPGHAAFSKMRARGAAVTDIIILVVAADDGVKPQTKESIRHIKNSGVPVIVAINKVDLKTSSPEMVKAQLYEEDIKVEGYDGSVPVVEISAKDGKNVDQLLDTITALAEIEEISTDPSAPAQGVVIESSLEKNQGPTATILVTAGEFHRGDELVSPNHPEVSGKAKRFLSDTRKPLTTVTVSTPAELLGLKDVPPVGTIFTTPEHLEAVTKLIADKTPPAKPDQPETPAAPEEPAAEPTSDSATETSPEESTDTPDQEPVSIKMILLADNAGSLEAIKQNLTDEIELIHSATGQVTESDVMMAQTTGAVIVAFNVKLNPSAKKLAEIERVPVNSYTIIYKLLEDFQDRILKLLEPTIDEEVLGIAEAKALFNIRGTAIIGCQVKSGQVAIDQKIHWKRGDKIISDARIVSLKQGKVDVKSVDAGTECGIVIKPALDVKAGDTLQAFRKNE